jgi:thioredoxin reductase (NADPH)
MINDESICSHLEEAAEREHGVRPKSHGCSECLASGGVWVHLRLCLTCGHVGCCDNSPNRHATKHHAHTNHPVIRSYEPGEAWAYCYPDQAYVEELPAFEGELAPVHYAPHAL